MRAENNELRLENQRLGATLSEACKAPTETADGDPKSEPAEPSESRLRAALASPATEPAQLRQAIAATEALLNEARRELAAKLLRARRAAFERLHCAIEAADEVRLAEALDAARSAEVDDDDIAKGAERLAELRSLTDEERAAKAARELELARKRQAFLLVKKDDAATLQALLDDLGQTVKWQEWRDHAGRTIWRCAQDLRAAQAQKVLAPRLGLQASGEPPRPRLGEAEGRGPPQAAGAPTGGARVPAPDFWAPPATCEFGEPITAAAAEVALQPAAAAAASEAMLQPVAAVAAEAALQPCIPLPLAAEPLAAMGAHNGPVDGVVVFRCPAIPACRMDSVDSLPPEFASDEDKLKARAFRAVARDDCSSLQEVLQCTTLEVMSRWHNRAGKDLLTLSEERGSRSAYSVLAKALGLMKEMKREAFEERESVWVFVQGDVQPRRATVLEETPAEADTVLLEYWDGDAPPERVDRCLVRRMWS